MKNSTNTILEKVIKVLRSSVRDDNNKLMIFPEIFENDPDFQIIKEKSEKTITLITEAEEKNDIEFLKRNFESDVWFSL